MAKMAEQSTEAIAFVWDNFGPMHVDRCEAVASHSLIMRPIVGIELFSDSSEYDWRPETGTKFTKTTLYDKSRSRRPSTVAVAWRLVSACINARAKDVFVCNYDRRYIFIAAVLLRLSGRRVYVMGCSKFDDVKRRVLKEFIKSFFLLPYRGAIASGVRSRDYFRFLGIAQERIVAEYNTLSTERIRMDSGVDPAPNGSTFEERHFTIVARFVEKKNLIMAIRAYQMYRENTARPRRLHLCGAGPLEADLRALVKDLALQDDVIFLGFLQTADVARQLGNTLALILPSIEEQFGNVVIEAQAVGLPVLLSDNCGARDKLIRSGVNGFVIEPDNPEGLSVFMKMLSDDQKLWASMATAALGSAANGDVRCFADGVQKLISRNAASARD
ncbi:glycosyltransferase [Rhizobium sp. WL3]|uniref:glycosyltransferase n=1 Tax=Rhizobium sp. WL3 TaxID=2603277 RepID=UPI001650BD0E|nr:glycosyltransferase [Rhizobium sp. WL3]